MIYSKKMDIEDANRNYIIVVYLVGEFGKQIGEFPESIFDSEKNFKKEKKWDDWGRMWSRDYERLLLT